MGAATRNIVIEQGVDYFWHALIQNAEDDTPFNLTGYTPMAKVREEADSAKVLATMTCTVGSPATGGELTLTMADTVTAAIPLGIYHWDLVIRSGSAPDIKLLKGKATVEATSSR